MFDVLALPKERRPSLFDLIANAVFQSSKQNHVIQIIFSGGAFLYKNGMTRQSSYNNTIYNSPTSQFEAPMLFSGGRTRRSLNRPIPAIPPDDHFGLRGNWSMHILVTRTLPGFC